MNNNYCYKTAQICLNGHITNQSCEDFDVKNSSNCTLCGAKTITYCTSCKTPIRGNLCSTSFDRLSNQNCTSCIEEILEEPAFCHNCGKPYPWTKEKIKSFQKIIDSLDNVSPELKKELKKAFPDIMCETPRTEWTAILLDQMLKQTAGLSADALKEWIKNHGVFIITRLLHLIKESEHF